MAEIKKKKEEEARLARMERDKQEAIRLDEFARQQTKITIIIVSIIILIVVGVLYVYWEEFLVILQTLFGLVVLGFFIAWLSDR